MKKKNLGFLLKKENYFSRFFNLRNTILSWFVLIFFMTLAVFLPNFVLSGYFTEYTTGYPINASPFFSDGKVYSKEEFIITIFFTLLFFELIILLVSVIPALLLELAKKFVISKKYKFFFKDLVTSTFFTAIILNLIILIILYL
jgi:hypothetical protein